MDRREANMKMISEADDLQAKTKESIARIKQQAAETEGLGSQTLEELRRQGTQMDDINTEIESVNVKLDQSSALQTKFDFWAGNWIGGKKRAAMAEAAQEIDQNNKTDHSKVREVFQHEKYHAFSSTWKFDGLVLCNNPAVAAPPIFDPNASQPDTRWSIDYSLAGIDAEGWTYATDFNYLNKHGVGDSAPKWNSYVRRRKWKFSEKNSGTSSAVESIRERQDARGQKQRLTQGATTTQAEKIGYVPRNRQTNLTASGLSSASIANRKGKAEDQELDSESAAGLARLKAQDSEINDGLDDISRSLDNLGNIAGAIKDEATTQKSKLERMENSMQKTGEKQTVVNARQRYLLK